MHATIVKWLGKSGYAKRAGAGGTDLVVHVRDVVSGAPHLGSDIECDEVQQTKLGKVAQSRAMNIKVLS